MSTWPSAASATSTKSRTSARTSTARATLAAILRPTSAAASRSCGSTLGSSTGSIPLLAKLDDRVEHGTRHLPLRGARDVALAARGEDGDLVGVGIEADVRARDVVDHHGIQTLAGQLVAAVSDDVTGAELSREPHQNLVGAPARRQARQDVLGALELELHAVARPVLLDLVARGVRGPKVADRRRHDQDVAGVEAAARCVGQVRCGLDVDVLDSGMPWKPDVGGQAGHRGAA